MKQHSPQFIAEMKALLLEEQAKLAEELGRTTHQQEGTYVADFPEYGQNEEDNATEIADYTAKSSVANTKEVRLREIEGALERIRESRYGITVDGKVIPENRLRANPAATTLIT